MNHILDIVKNLDETTFEKGEDILRQGERKNQLWILLDGRVEVIKNGQQICQLDEKGAVFGELSVFLKTFHNATVRALTDCRFCIIERAGVWFEENPAACLHLAKVLARRLALLDSYVAELKKEFADLSGRVEETTAIQSEKSHLLTEFLKKAEKGIEARGSGKEETQVG